MYAPKYFPVKYFAPRYFPPSGIIVAEFELEVPTFATPQDPLSGAFVPDVGHILSVMDAEGGLLCDIVDKGLTVSDANGNINVNDTGANSVLCNTVNINRVIVNSDPQGIVTEVDC